MTEPGQISASRVVRLGEAVVTVLEMQASRAQAVRKFTGQDVQVPIALGEIDGVVALIRSYGEVLEAQAATIASQEARAGALERAVAAGVAAAQALRGASLGALVAFWWRSRRGGRS